MTIGVDLGRKATKTNKQTTFISVSTFAKPSCDVLQQGQRKECFIFLLSLHVSLNIERPLELVRMNCSINEYSCV